MTKNQRESVIKLIEKDGVPEFLRQLSSAVYCLADRNSDDTMSIYADRIYQLAADITEREARRAYEAEEEANAYNIDKALAHLKKSCI
jgi:hypothetical protein